MPRPQFTLRSLLVAMLVVGTFFGGMACGMALQRKLDRPKTVLRGYGMDSAVHIIEMPDGSRWQKEGGQLHYPDYPGVSPVIPLPTP